jgi:hypothetical protein
MLEFHVRGKSLSKSYLDLFQILNLLGVGHNILESVLGRPSKKDSKTTVIPKIW